MCTSMYKFWIMNARYMDSATNITYSITSVAWTRMARSPWMIQTLFSVPTKFFQ